MENLILKAWLIFLISQTMTLNAYSGYKKSGFDKDARDFTLECKEVSKYSVKGKYQVDCSQDFHHFNSETSKSIIDLTSSKLVEAPKESIKIAEFNVLHPGMAKTRFKDYKKIASLINKWDVIGMTELLPLVANDLLQNTSLVKYIEVYAPGKIKLYEAMSKDLNIKLGKTTRERRIKSLNKKLNIAKKMVAFYKAEIIKAKKNYREPGYLKILNELHKLRGGKNWSLVLSPRGEAAKASDTHELVGYYYRSNLVKPIRNQYCKDVKKGKLFPFACIAQMGKKMLRKDKSDIFSRRPFMASFKAKSFSFTLLTSHVIYTSPKEEKLIQSILGKSFGVKHWRELSTGINGGNYARFAEVKVTLDFINALRKKYKEKDIIYMGDLNLNYKNKFWPKVLKSVPGFDLFIESKTSLSKSRFHSNGEETQGLSNDFDHFLFDPSYTNECLNSQGQANTLVENFFKGSVGRYVKRYYQVRTERVSSTSYLYNQAKFDRLIKQFVTPYKNGTKTFLKIGNKKITSSGKAFSVKGLVTDKKELNFYADFFEARILKSQLKDKSYYTFYADILSDHMPIVLECKI
jgi:hypothetical protein